LASEYVADEVTRPSVESKVNTTDSRDVFMAIISIVDIPTMFFAILMCVVIFWRAFKGEVDILTIIALYLLGSIVVLMILETAPRYTVAYRVFFPVLAVCFIRKLYELRHKTLTNTPDM
jgi:hypothetical protein